MTTAYTVRFKFERGSVFVYVHSVDDAAALEDAKKEFAAQFESDALLKRVERIEVYEGGKELHEPQESK